MLTVLWVGLWILAPSMPRSPFLTLYFRLTSHEAQQ